uniref:asparagine synthase-related protein n=1 Tax=Eubacterium cellulosolvens TaxID=29322 RepID=UPI0004834A74|nr:asparagine synthetase B family protein [[Eubacterium] cellulosolvens]
MSAIWGIIDFKGNSISEDDRRTMREAFDSCRIDRWETLEAEGLYLGCGIQYFTEEAKREVLPVKTGNCYLTADVMIENREELIDPNERELPDGGILQRLLEEDPLHAPEKIVGVCAAVWYDASQKQVLLFSDSVGYHFVYYTMEDGRLYFSSLLEPLAMIRKELHINERFVADYIGQDNLNAFTESEETPYAEIFRTAPAQKVLVGEKRLKKEYYWDPVGKRKKIRLGSDQEYKDAFLKLYRKCTEQTLRSAGKTAIFLSGGYDSTSVAALATEILKERNERLSAYTSVPLKGCVIDKGEHYETDESEAVKKTAEYYGNIDVNLCDFPEMNPWFSAPEYQKICEMPYKSPENLLWMYGIMEKAAEDGCRIILGGMFGNGTVSYDNARAYFSQLFRRGHLLRLRREINRMHEKQFFTRKSMWLTTLCDSVRRSFKIIKSSGYAQTGYLRKWGTQKRLMGIRRKSCRDIQTETGYHKCFLARNTFRHYGEYAQHHSLYTGVLLLDPTRDRRLVDFCMSLPPDQFTGNGAMRRLVADYMKELMPPHVLNSRKHGLQSADQTIRLIRKKDKIAEDWLRIYREHANDPRVNTEKAMGDLKAGKMEECEEFNLTRHIYTTCFLRYMDRVEKMCEEKKKSSIQTV